MKIIRTITTFPVFLIAFLISDYMITGAVTATWIGIALVAAVLTTLVKLGIEGLWGKLA